MYKHSKLQAPKEFSQYEMFTKYLKMIYGKAVKPEKAVLEHFKGYLVYLFEFVSYEELKASTEDLKQGFALHGRDIEQELTDVFNWFENTSISEVMELDEAEIERLLQEGERLVAVNN